MLDIDREAHPERPLASGAISISSAQNFVKVIVVNEYNLSMIGAYSLHKDGNSIIELVTIYVIAITLMLTYDHGPDIEKYWAER